MASLTYQHSDRMDMVVGYERNQKSGYHSDNYYFRLKYDF
ncbi:hypothetical protein CI610_03581 [invertebrate metagenome]|uniref:Uncharacterized protein n=1 Tax=invertebrate metagenome TaxID=1711999 RepID=A0A2H9T2N6_9ZZZZ